MRLDLLPCNNNEGNSLVAIYACQSKGVDGRAMGQRLDGLWDDLNGGVNLFRKMVTIEQHCQPSDLCSLIRFSGIPRRASPSTVFSLTQE